MAFRLFFNGLPTTLKKGDRMFYDPQKQRVSFLRGEGMDDDYVLVEGEYNIVDGGLRVCDMGDIISWANLIGAACGLSMKGPFKRNFDVLEFVAE